MCSNYCHWLQCSREAAAVLLRVQRIGRRMGEQKGQKVAAAGTASCNHCRRRNSKRTRAALCYSRWVLHNRLGPRLYRRSIAIEKNKQLINI